ncbi:protease inhibitor Inh/omp19 family protein [Ancylobacter mangrovi]|uniref:protease inhibitor Inh/omp19 family protein n=1 Tax=Ancylobacter mangrovi TaxID=2972472 RepID=UPI002163830B|nr:protease inhibitor Inh/omp19 family protein [Ancylobacter mangrovi]MCS0504003.1 protease inhibitor Inh/omp19 family protein [Ancylobacter mangrovi]
MPSWRLAPFLCALLLAPAMLAIPGGTALRAQDADAREPSQTDLSQAGSASTDPSPAQAATALAADYQLTNADGDQVCAMSLSARRRGGQTADGGPLFDLSFDRQACAATILFSPDIAAWTPASGNSIQLLRGDGSLVAEFTEGIDGTWEALREGDGVYFLVNPRIADAARIQPSDLFGQWDLGRAPGRPACRIRFSDAPMRPSGYRLDPDPNCGLLFGRASTPDRWRLEQGELILENATGARLHFSPNEDDDWIKVPADNRPLFLTRVP